SRHPHPGEVGNALDRLGKAQSFELREKSEVIAGNTASEAMVAALPVLAVEGRTLLAVERAARPVVTLSGIRLPAIPRHARADDRGNRHPVPDLVKEGRGKAHRQARLSFIYPPAASVTTPIAAPSEAMPGIHKTAKGGSQEPPCLSGHSSAGRHDPGNDAREPDGADDGGASPRAHACASHGSGRRASNGASRPSSGGVRASSGRDWSAFSCVHERACASPPASRKAGVQPGH